MTTAFGTIVAAIKTRLEAAPAVSAQVWRARLTPVAAQHLDAVVVRIQSGIASRFGILNGPMDWDTTIDIECYARSTTLTADAAVDALLAKVWARLAADSSLGGLVMDLNPTEVNYDLAGEGDQLACVTLSLKVLHRTQNQSLE
jgi:hypothetical protein